MKGPSVLGIDVGYKNFAYCFIRDGRWRKPLIWENISLFQGKYNEKKAFDALLSWTRKEQDMLRQADAIVLEKQMARKFVIMNTVIRTLFWQKCTEVSPLTISKDFHIPRERLAKKRAAIELASANASFPLGATAKKDDLADAYLLALWHLKHANSLEGFDDESGSETQTLCSNARRRKPVQRDGGSDGDAAGSQGRSSKRPKTSDSK